MIQQLEDRIDALQEQHDDDTWNL